jgi:hypothetical protein
MQDTGTGFTAGPGGRRTAGPRRRRQSGRALRIGFVLDVAGYGMRTVPERDDVQRRLRQLVDAMLAACGLRLHRRVVDYQWTGDGINVVLPSDVDPPAALGVLVRSLAAELDADKARHADRIRLRMAIGVGLIERRAAGFGGPVIVDINRLVDSEALRSALSSEPDADLAVALSDQTYTLIIQPGYPGIPPGQFTQANVTAKEFTGAAWLWLSARQWSAPAYLPLGVTDPRDVGGYRIAARIGGGQSGQVYLASGDPGQVDLAGVRAGWTALKVFDPALAADPSVHRKLSLAAIAARVTRGPHVATVVDSGVDETRNRPWVASTLVRGPSLASTVAETGRLPENAGGWTALGLAGALSALHEAGFSHDAVSPHNVLLSAGGPVLTDLGTSRTALLSAPGSPAEDVLMLGATVFFSVAGRSPWGDGPALARPADAPARAEHPDLTGCPPLLAPIVRACLNADPAARPTAARLQSWLAGEIGQRPRSWLPAPVAARLGEYQSLPPPRARFRWPRGRDQ